MTRTILIALLGGAAIAHASVLQFTNFGGPQLFDTANGWEIDGGLDGGQTVAVQFTMPQSTPLESVDLALGIIFTDLTVSPIAVSLYSDVAGLPGADLSDLKGGKVGPFPPGNLVQYACSVCPTLAGGTPYWLVASIADLDTDHFNTMAAWNWNTTQDYSSGSNLAFGTNSASGWTLAGNNVLRPAFGINTPEPGTWSLLVMGMVLVALRGRARDRA